MPGPSEVTMAQPGLMKSKSENPTYYWFVWSGVMSAVVAALFGPFTVKFLQRIGGTDFYISLLNSLPGIIGVAVSLPGALWLAGHRGKGLKALTVEMTLASRLLVLSLIPLVWLSPTMAPLCCVVLLALKNIPESISQTAFQGLTGDLFPLEARSTAITQRNRYSVPATLAVTLIAGLVLRELPGNDAQRLTIYQIFFALAAAFGAIEALFMHRMESTEPHPADARQDWRGITGMILKDKKFMRYAGASLVYYFSWQMGWPLFSIYQVINLGADELWLSIIGILSAIGMFAGFKFWNRVIIKHGNIRTAVFATLGMSINPVIMAVFPNLYWVSGVNLFLGFFTAGTVTVLLSALLEVTPQENRVVYVGTYNTFVNASLAISPIVAFLVLRAVGIIPALVVVCVCRLIGALAFWLYGRKSEREKSLI
jgi:hypothetical protein